MPRTPVLLLALVAIAGCGGGDSPVDSGAATPQPSAPAPTLATRPAATGEIIVRGEASPATKGPYTFDGSYLVRFEQYAPEDAKLDFSGQTPFSAALTRTAGDPRGATTLFEAAARSGRRTLTIRGRYFAEVSFGDFPYVLRFTPRGR